MSQKQNFGLGRGLGSLIPSKDSIEKQSAQKPSMALASKPVGEIFELDVDLIKSNRHQPRKHFDEEDLNDLSASIREHGIIQPLVVVQDSDGTYELIAGERRLRASKMAGLKKVPIIKREADELDRLELALIENIQRSDLNPIEEGEAYQKLNDEFGLSHEEIGRRVGKSRPLISNAIRLLALPQEVQKAISERKITSAHGRLLLEMKDEKQQLEMLEKIISERLNISDTTREVRAVSKYRYIRKVRKDPNLDVYEQELRARLGTKVVIGKRGKKTGLITIEFYSEDEMRNIISKIMG